MHGGESPNTIQEQALRDILILGLLGVENNTDVRVVVPKLTNKGQVGMMVKMPISTDDGEVKDEYFIISFEHSNWYPPGGEH